jgi:hypothetical protein
MVSKFFVSPVSIVLPSSSFVMARIVSILYLAGTSYALAAAAVVDFRVPLTFAPDGTLFVNETVPGTDGSPRIQVVVRNGITGRYRPVPRMNITNTIVPVLELEIQDPLNFCVRSNSGIVSFGMLRNDILDQVGAFAVIRSQTQPPRAELVFGSTMEDFLSTCVPGTLISFPSRGERATHKLTNATRAVIEKYRVRGIRFGDSHIEIASVSHDMHTRIQQEMIAQGSSYERRFGHYISCTPETLHGLPNVEIETPGATLVLYPQDYIKFTSNNTCIVELGYSGLYSNIEVNPLLFSGTNARVSSEDNIWHICKTAATL